MHKFEPTYHRPHAIPKVIDKLNDIVKSLSTLESEMKNFSVHDGWLGLCLFYCFYSRYSDNEFYLDKAAECLNKALAIVHPNYYKRQFANDSYDYRIANLGQFFRLVNNNGFLNIGNYDLLHNVDHFLLKLAKIKIKEGDFNRFSGALCAGHYFYYCEKQQFGREEILGEIVNGLVKNAVEDTEGAIYWNSRGLQYKVYLGTHGCAMNIAFLASMLEERIESEKCVEILQKALKFLAKHRNNHPHGIFPIFVGQPYGETQFSQCYGDLGIGYSMFKAAKALNDQKLMHEAEGVLFQCIARRSQLGHTPDASMTYGAAGIAHVFDKLSRLTHKNEHFLKSRNYWQAEIPGYAKYSNDFAGFESFLNTTNDIKLSYGWGTIGIGISLMKYLDPTLPDLDSLNIII